MVRYGLGFDGGIGDTVVADDVLDLRSLDLVTLGLLLQNFLDTFTRLNTA